MLSLATTSLRASTTLHTVGLRGITIGRASTTTSTPTPLPPSPAAPRRYQRAPVTDRELPTIKSRAPLYLFIAITSAISWGSFLYYATHNERSSSSIVRSLTFQLTHSEPVRHFLGDGVRIKPLFGEFRKVDGSINMLAGVIDVQFRLTGSTGKGTASFRSIRRGKTGVFEVLKWEIRRDDGALLDLSGSDPRRVDGLGVQEEVLPLGQGTVEMV